MAVRLLHKHRKIIIVLLLLLIFIVLILHNKSKTKYDEIDDQESLKPKLAILVPFRDRFDELIHFVPYISKFLRNQPIGPFRIFILNQSRKYRFNRGALINAGFLLTKNQSDYIAIHDVDLLPINQNLSYAYPDKGPHHLTSPQYHPNYNYEKYFGGILLMKNEHFELVNGFSNVYFGWGLEDDEFYTRVKAARLNITRPTDLKTNKNNTFLHFHYERKRDTSRTREQKEALRFRDRRTGLRDLIFSVESSHNLTIDGEYDCTIFNIELYCNTKQTPWCLPVSVRSRS